MEVKNIKLHPTDPKQGLCTKDTMEQCFYFKL